MSQLHCIYSSDLPLAKYWLLQPSVTRNHTQQYLSIDKLNILKTQKLHMTQTNKIRQLSSYCLTDTHDLKPPSQLLVECQEAKTGGNDIRRPTPRNRYEFQQHNQGYHKQGRCGGQNEYKNKINKGCRGCKGQQKKIDLKNELKSSRKEVLRYRPKQKWEMNEKQKQDSLMNQNSIELQQDKQNQNIQQTNSTHCQYASIKQKSTSANIPENYHPDPNSIQTQSPVPAQKQTQTILKIPIFLEFSFYHNIYAITIVSISSYFHHIDMLICNLWEIVGKLEQHVWSMDRSQGRNRGSERGKVGVEELGEWRYMENALRVVVLSKICQFLNKNKQVMAKEQKDLAVRFQKMLDQQIKIYCQSKLKRHKTC